MQKTLFGALVSCLVLASGVDAQDNYPSRPMTMVIPFAAGGPQDQIGRLVAQRMSEIAGQQVVVERYAIGAGRLHHDPRQRRHPRPEPDALQEAAL
jgi:tripartite-type tricarboxylate transporter receptor subunit TctC